MYPEELKKSISRGETAPIYFFYGENTLHIDEAVESIKALLFQNHNPDFDLYGYDAQTHDVSEIVQSARSFPFVSRKKLLVVKGVDSFKESQWEKFQSYFSSPSDYCCLVFISEEQRMPVKLSTIFKKKVITVPFANPRNKNEIKEFIRLGLQKSGKRINPDALNYFAENTEGDALTINSEMEKTVLFCREKNIINVEDIEEILSRGHKFTIFNLVDEIGRGNIENALIFLSNLLDKGEHPLYILKMISRQFRLICRAREGIRRGDSASIIGQLLNLRYEGIIKSIITQAKGWTDEGLGKAFEEIFQSDFMIKSSRIKGKVILENLVFRLINFRNQLSA